MATKKKTRKKKSKSAKKAKSAAKKTSPAMEFLLAQLKKSPKISYGDVKAAAAKKSLTVYPIMYGRAQALLGLVKVKPRGSKKKQKRGPGRPPVLGRRGPGRPRKQTNAMDSLEAMITDMKDVARDRDRYQRALEQIARIIHSL